MAWRGVAFRRFYCGGEARDRWWRITWAFGDGGDTVVDAAGMMGSIPCLPTYLPVRFYSHVRLDGHSTCLSSLSFLWGRARGIDGGDAGWKTEMGFTLA